jgi:formylglycine-generating enzyme required for sulfatase activity
VLRVAKANVNDEGAFAARAALYGVRRAAPDHPEVDALLKQIDPFLYRSNHLDMWFSRIDPGKVMMGSHPQQPGHRRGEVYHSVTMTRRYWLGTTEVTNAQFSAVMGFSPSLDQSPQLPVTNVTWGQAMEFCQKLGQMPKESAAGARYRLPTEAEWEYACRAGLDDLFSWASKPDDLGWFYVRQPGRRAAPNVPNPVAGKRPNAWGLYDMHGNVAEFCLDVRPNYTEEPVTDPTGPMPSQARAIAPVAVRGGSLANLPEDCRSASRSSVNRAANGQALVGFRVVMELRGEGPGNADGSKGGAATGGDYAPPGRPGTPRPPGDRR